MMKWCKRLISLALVAGLIYLCSVVSDKQQLEEQVLRLHVVADSDSAADQAVKRKVRDAVLTAVEQAMSMSQDKEEAHQAVEGMLQELEDIANGVLASEGVADRAVVTLQDEEFPRRVYDTFTLPAGVYDALRITIGSGEGQNWWCVLFPNLCVPAVSEEVEDVAAGAGFSDTLSSAITHDEGYEIRFFLLDCLGRMENFFHRG